MTMPNRERAEEEAAEWLVLLAEEPDDAGIRAEFEAWCAIDPLNAEIWDRTARAYAVIGQAEPTHEEQWQPHAQPGATMHRLPPAPPARSRRDGRGRTSAWRNRKRIIRAAMMGAVAAALAVMFMPTLVIHFRSDYATGTAEACTIELADGSKARLGPRTAIAVDFENGERSIRILSGEVWFDVTHDARHPFRVKSRDARVTVLGTAFDVLQGEDDTKVAVERGHVRVEPTDAIGKVGWNLLAGDSVAVGGATEPEISRIPTGEVGDRTRGTLVVRDRPVSEIVEALRPWYGGMIVLRGEEFARWRVSGLYDLRDPAGTLTTLTKQYGGTVRQITPWLLIASAD